MAGFTVAMVALAGSGCRDARSTDDDVTGRGGGPAAGTFERTLTVDGQRRTFRVHVPRGVAGRVDLPVVVGLHGGGGNGEQFERQSQLSDVADRAGFVAVYPDGNGRTRLLTWNAGTCCGYARDQGIDDVRFVAAMLDELTSRYRIDPRRVYVTGLSNGAMMSYRIACELADRITAIAPVAGALNVDSCRPSRPLSVLVLHGTADPMVPYQGGPPTRTVPGAGSWQNGSVPDAVAFWTTQDRCPSSPTQSRDGVVVRTSYGPCADGVEVNLYTIEGGGHAWPGGLKSRDAADEPPPLPDASTLMWDFFSRFPVS
jgi:polyhydroxybutyrate depolymerase